MANSKLKEIQQHIQPELQALNDKIHDELFSANELINSIVANYLTTKGKQIRPIIVLLSARMFGTVTPAVISAATAVELLHNSSLIHDDVVDESKLRRGHDTINSVWDNHIAVLMGDFFVSVALRTAIETGDLRIVASLSNLGKLLSLGELDQIYNARYHTLTEDAYFEIIGRKTASLFVACSEMGCYAMGVDDRRLDALCEYARLLGLCFQIKDDIFDYYDSDAIGKPTGNDLLEGKITLPLLHALLAPGADPQMAELSRKDHLEADEVATLVQYAKERGGIEYAYDTMRRLRQRGVELLEAEFPDSEVRRMFVDIFDYIIDRDK